MVESETGKLEPEGRFNEASNRRFFAVLLAVALLYLWILPIRSSFWLDETGTFWIIKDGLANLFTRSFEWAGGISPFYYLTAWMALVLGGCHEWVLRLPSLAAALTAAWLLYKLAARLFDGTTARLTVLVFACCDSVAFAAVDARPYSFGLCMLMGSAWMLVQWLDTRRRRYTAAYILLSALAIYAHYFFGLGCLVLGLYALWRVFGEDRKRRWEMIVAWMAVGALTLPLFTRLLRLYQSRSVHSFASTPGLVDLFASIAPPVILGSIAIGFLLAWLVVPPPKPGLAIPRANLYLAVGWALTPPIVLFVVSVLSPIKLFIPRYYISCTPGLSLVVAWVIRSLTTGVGQRIVASTLLLSAVASFSTFSHGDEDWAGAMQKVRSLAKGSNMPVLTPSGFVEATDPQALRNPELREVLFAPELMYPPGGKLVPLPYRLDEESTAYAEQLLPSLEQHDRFVLVVRLEGFLFEPWLRGRLAQAGFHSQRVGNFGRIGVFLFQR